MFVISIENSDAFQLDLIKYAFFYGYNEKNRTSCSYDSSLNYIISHELHYSSRSNLDPSTFLTY